MSTAFPRVPRLVSVCALACSVAVAQDGSINPAGGQPLGGSATANASHDVSIVYVNIAGHPTNVVPGTGGLPFNVGSTTSSAFNRPYTSPDGAHWGIQATAEIATTNNDNVYVVDGTLFLREGDQAPWAPAGETVGSLDMELGLINSRAILIANGTLGTAPATANDYVVLFDPNGNTTVLAQEGGLLGGVVPPLAPGTWDDDMAAVGMSNNGVMAWRATGLDSTPGGTLNDACVAIVGGTSLIEGITVPSGLAGGATDPWQNFDLGDVFVSGSGRVLVQGDTSAAAGDDIVALDNNVVIQEDQIIPGSGFVNPVDVDGIVQAWIDGSDNWYVRGNNDATEQDWVVRNGVVVARTGDVIVPGRTERYSDGPFADCFFAMDGNPSGHFLIGGVTDNTDLLRNGVLVLYDGAGGSRIVVREGDAVDLNGNGLPDDDAFFDIFGNDDAKLLPDNSVLFVASLRNGAGTAIANGLFRLTEKRASCVLRNGSGVNPIDTSCSTLPVLGTTWSFQIATPPSTPATLVLLGFLPAQVPFLGQEILIDLGVNAPAPISLGMTVPGVHDLPLPNLLAGLGLRFYTQGFRLTNGQLVLTNAIDAVLGR